MASINDVGSTTILSLANEVRDIARNICNRSGSLADCLGGSQPECGNEEKAHEPSDLHGILQRALTTLRETQDELQRSERVIGIGAPLPQVAISASAGCATKSRY